jgi:hypothetical protein
VYVAVVDMEALCRLFVGFLDQYHLYTIEEVKKDKIEAVGLTVTCCEGKTGVVIREWFLASWSGIFIWRKVVLKGRKDRRSRGTQGWRK